MAAVRDRIRRANNPITLRGLQLGRQPETAKEFAFLFTCRGIDENKCIQLLRNRQTSSRRSARIPFGMPLPKGEVRARRHLRLRARIQSLPQIPILAPVKASEEQVSQNTTNYRSGRSDGLRAPQWHTACSDRQKVAVSSTEGTAHLFLLGTITENAPRRGTGHRRDSAIGSFILGYPPIFFYSKEKNRVETTPNVSIRTTSAPGRLIRIRERLGTNVAKRSVSAKLTLVRCAHREHRNCRLLADRGKWASGTLATRERRAWHLRLIYAPDFRAPVSYAHWSAGECITASPGTPDRNKPEPDGVSGRHRPTCAPDFRAPVRYAHRSAGECVTASPGTPDRNKTEPDDVTRRHRPACGSTDEHSQEYSQRRHTRPASAASHNLGVEPEMEPPFPPVPGVSDPLFPGVVTFTSKDLGSQVQSDVSINRLFAEGATDCVPLYGPFCYLGTSKLAAQMLFMLSRRSSAPWRLLVSLTPRPGEEEPFLPAGVRQSRILSAAQGIDDASGLSLKAGPTGRYQEFKVDQHGRTSAAGQTVYCFNLQLKLQNIMSAPLIQESLKLVSTVGNSLQPTDPLLIQQWPSHQGDVKRLLLPAMESTVSLHLLHSRLPVPAAVAEVSTALQLGSIESRKDFLMYRDFYEGADVVVLLTLNAALMSFLLLTCPNFGSAGVSACRPEISLIRQLPPNPAKSSSLASDIDMASDEPNEAAGSPSSSTWAARLRWTRPPTGNKDSMPRVTRGVSPQSEPMLDEHLLNRLHGIPVYQRSLDRVGPSLIISFPHCCLNFDYAQIQGEVAALLTEHISMVSDVNPRDFSFARWESEIGALYTWTPAGRRLCRILVRVQPGTTFALVIDALNGKFLSWDPEQPLFPQLTMCICNGCQQHLRDTTGYGCVECAAMDHLAGTTDCPRLQARRAQLQLRKEQTAKMTPAPTSGYSTIPIAEPVDRLAATPKGKLSTLQEGHETESDSSDSDPERSSAARSSGVACGSSTNESKTLDATTLQASSLLEAAAQLRNEASQSEITDRPGPGRGRGKGDQGRSGGRGRQSGRGGGKPTIPWLCPFCHEPTGLDSMHNSKQCNRPLKLPAPADLQWSRCAFCNHAHPWMECPIMYDSYLGIPILPQTIVDIAERLGYKTTLVGSRRTISTAALLPQLPGRPGSQSGSSSSSQNSVALSSVSDRSTTIMDVAAQETLALVRQQGLDIIGQVTSLRDMVKELSAGQQSLQSKQSELQEQLAAQASANVKMMQSMLSLKSEFLSFQTTQEQKFAEEQAKYKESMDKLNELFSEDVGVKGPLGAMDTDHA